MPELDGFTNHPLALGFMAASHAANYAALGDRVRVKSIASRIAPGYDRFRQPRA